MQPLIILEVLFLKKPFINFFFFLNNIFKKRKEEIS